MFYLQSHVTKTSYSQIFPAKFHNVFWENVKLTSDTEGLVSLFYVVEYGSSALFHSLSAINTADHGGH